MAAAQVPTLAAHQALLARVEALEVALAQLRLERAPQQHAPQPQPAPQQHQQPAPQQQPEDAYVEELHQALRAELLANMFDLVVPGVVVMAPEVQALYDDLRARMPELFLEGDSLVRRVPFVDQPTGEQRVRKWRALHHERLLVLDPSWEQAAWGSIGIGLDRDAEGWRTTVRSATGAGVYEVVLTQEGLHCHCPDFEHRFHGEGGQCKHAWHFKLKYLKMPQDNYLCYQDAYLPWEWRYIKTLRAAAAAPAAAPAAAGGGGGPAPFHNPCAICYEEFVAGERVKRCRACFGELHTVCFNAHKVALDRQHRAVFCPLCRAAPFEHLRA